MSKLNEGMRIDGVFHITVWDELGQIKDERFSHNLTVTEGFDAVLDEMFGAGGPVVPFDYIGVGTAATSLAEGDSALEGEVDTQQGTYSHDNNTKSGTLAYTWGTGNDWALKESGLFNSDGGTMFCRGTFAVVNVGTLDTFEMEWRYTLS
jgi:hypothetical protein